MPPEDEVPPAFFRCRNFRRLAKRCRELGETKDPSSQPKRTSLIEDLWDLGTDFDVWVGGIAQALALAVLYLYDGEDTDAASILNHLADEELESLRDRTEQDEEDEDEASGSVGEQKS